MSQEFLDASHSAIQNKNLQEALMIMKNNHKKKRDHSLMEFPQFEDYRNQAKAIKDHTLDNLDFYMEKFIANCESQGGIVHLCQFPHEARQIIVKICKSHKAKKITKGKSMVSEEIHLNSALELAGFKVVETDLGEYIVQLRNETPSHIIGPALHVLKEEVRDLFYEKHTKLKSGRRLDTGASLVAEARKILRQEFLSADIGITGANFLVAQTGSGILITNEGNGDLTRCLPKVHIVITTIEKLVPTMNDAFGLIRLLARSGTGQHISTYTTIFNGAKKTSDLDGPSEFHVVILDNGRTNILKSASRDMLRCLKCGACMNNCPVYQTIGGHAYGTTYMGPIGAALSPHLNGVKRTEDLPFASSLCGKCEEVCPVKIPIPRILRQNREAVFNQSPSKTSNLLIRLWGIIAQHPKLYRFLTRLQRQYLRLFITQDAWITRVPLIDWTATKDFPAPAPESFMELYEKSKK